MHFKPLQILPCTPPSRETILVDAIFDEVTETKLHIFLSIGQLLHVASESREVNLPFLTKTLISLTRRGDVHFQEELPSCVFNLMTDYIYKSYTVHDRRSQKMVEISKPGHTNIVELRELIGNEKENGSAFQTSVISRYETMREYVLYIPDSSLHLKISICRAYSRSSPDESLVSAREVDWNTYGATKKDSPLVAREILMFVERSQSFVPSQDIPTVETIEKAATLTSPLSNSECPEQHQNSAALLEKVESTKGWRICPNLALLQVYLKQHKRKQLTSMVAHLIQCGLQVTTVLFEHSRQLTILSTTAVTKDIAKCTQQHYDRKKVFSARESAIRNLREYNNLVKQGIYAAHIKKGTEAVLDLACGHGQDMPKFLGLEIRHFVGVDISEQEILEAKRRSGSLKFQNMKISLYSGNILHESTYLQLPISLYNAVTVQLAIHYCVENEATADFMLGTISNHLKDDGYFLGSTGCSDVIAKRLTDAYLHPDDHTMDYDLLENPDVSFGNSVYRVGFSRSLVERLLANADDTSATDDLNRNEVLFRLNKTLSSQWGIQYHFFLVDHIDAPEYVVPWTSFVQMAAKHNLRLLYDETFDRAFDDLDQVKDTAVRNRLFKLRRMELSTSENEVFSFYKIFVFKKSKIPIDPAEKEDLLFSPHSADQNSSERTNFHSKAQGGCNSQKRSMNKHFAPDNPYPKFKRTASQFRGGRGRPSNKKFYGNNGLVTPASHRYHPKGNSYRVFQDYSEEKNRFQKASDYQRPTEKFDEVEIKFPSETEPSSEDPLNFEARPIYIKGSETPEFLASPHMFAMDEALSSERGSISSTSSSHDSPLSQVLEKAA